MSLTAFKRKSVINYGSRRSGIAPGGVWLSQGPFGTSKTALQIAIDNPGAVGFSINGGHRNVGGVGREMKMSKSGTPFRGNYPIGWGGGQGAYIESQGNAGSRSNMGGSNYASFKWAGPWGGVVSNDPKWGAVEPLLNARIAQTMGTQYLYVKPSVLSTKGMLQKKIRWAYNGQYPNYWVQPNYTGNQTDSGSQKLYIQNKASANTCNLKVNNVGDYENYFVGCGPTLCTPGRSTATFKYNDMARNAPYTKTLYQPVSYSQYNAYLTRGCNNPVGPQKPFPYAVSTGSSQSAAGTSITSFATGCNTSPTYIAPPAWYTATPYWYKNKNQKQNPHTNYHIPPGSRIKSQQRPFIGE
jgi:hypothetical protein